MAAAALLAALLAACGGGGGTHVAEGVRADRSTGDEHTVSAEDGPAAGEATTTAPARATDGPSTTTATATPATTTTTRPGEPAPLEPRRPACTEQPKRQTAPKADGVAVRPDGSVAWRRSFPVPVDGLPGMNVTLLDGGDLAVGTSEGVERVDPATGGSRWKAPIPMVFGASLRGGTLVVLSGEGGQYGSAGRMIGLDPATGARRWVHLFTDRRQNGAVAPVGADGLAVIDSPGDAYNPRRLTVYGPDGSARWMVESNGDDGALLAGDRLQWAGGSQTRSFEPTTGTVRWASQNTGYTTLLKAGAVTIVSTYDTTGRAGHAVARRSADGIALWERDLGELQQLLADDDGQLLLVDAPGGRISLLDPSTGAVRGGDALVGGTAIHSVVHAGGTIWTNETVTGGGGRAKLVARRASDLARQGVTDLSFVHSIQAWGDGILVTQGFDEVEPHARLTARSGPTTTAWTVDLTDDSAQSVRGADGTTYAFATSGRRTCALPEG